MYVVTWLYTFAKTYRTIKNINTYFTISPVLVPKDLWPFTQMTAHWGIPSSSEDWETQGPSWHWYTETQHVLGWPKSSFEFFCNILPIPWPAFGVGGPGSKCSPGPSPSRWGSADRQTCLVVISPSFNIQSGSTHLIVKGTPTMSPHPMVIEPLRHSGVWIILCQIRCQSFMLGTSLVLQWLRLCAPNAGGPGLIRGQGTRYHIPQLKILHAATKRYCRPQWRSHVPQLRPGAAK